MKRKPRHTFLSLLLILILPITIIGQVDYTELIPPLEVSLPESPGNDTLLVDLNNDSITDFKLGVNYYYTNYSGKESFICYYSYFDGMGQNLIAAKPLSLGTQINDSLTFALSEFICGYSRDYMGPLGAWNYYGLPTGNTGLMGIKILNDNEYHFGWIEVETNGESISLLRYGLNSIPNEPIEAGQSE